MKAWDDPTGRDRGSRPGRPDARALGELEEQGIDLDPDRPTSHRHGDVEHASDHRHPHAQAEPGQPPIVGIVGAGAVGTALGVALSRGGWPVSAWAWGWR